MAESAVVLAVVAAACAVPGAFLVLRRVSLVSDAIGHVLLFGVVVTFFVVRRVDSPWLLAGAAAAGLLSAVLVELLGRTRLVKQDAALGLVFPALFAGGVLLASVYTRDIHLDVDQVFLGRAEFAKTTDWRFGLAVGVLALNLALFGVFYKELKLTTFDPGLAAALGFRPGLVHYALMAVVSVTAGVAFDAVGPVLVVGFFAVPAAAAYLLTDRLAVMVGLAVVIGVVGAVAGTVVAVKLDASVAGAVAAVLGALFALAFALAPGRGLAAQAVRRRRQWRDFHETMLAVHLLQHEGTAAEADEAGCGRLHEHLGWAEAQAAAVVGRAERHGLVRRDGDLLKLTATGRTRAREVLGGGGVGD